MSYKRSPLLIQKRLTKKEKNKIIKSLKESFKEASKECDTSPCLYRGCELWGWCKDCKGWHNGCSARLPECIFKNKDGTWREDEY